MCGITGIIRFDQQTPDKAKLTKMNDLLSHRGPDHGAVFINKQVGLGHRRLSIIDLSEEANQPFQYYRNEGHWIVYNGEVYNYLELREELKQVGYIFKTSSDTEVVLTAYLEWGEACFHRFNGMWAMAIYNCKDDSVLLCRDRFGIKPLYYCQDQEKFLFASEKKAIVLSDFIDLEFDPKGIRTALFNPFQLEASGYTEFKGVKNVLPGHLIRIKNKTVEVERWYSLLKHIDKKVPATFDKRVNKFQNLFRDSCRLRLRSDVPIATSLSGGLDSSSVVATLSQLDNAKHTTYVHSFKGNILDETAYAEIVAETTNTPIKKIEVDKVKAASAIDDIIYYFESVYGGMPDSPYRIYKKQREDGCKISIDGHGADEMLAGYGWYLDELQKDISLFNPVKLWDVFQHRKGLVKQREQNGLKRFIKFMYDRFPPFLQKRIKQLVKRTDSESTVYYTFMKEELPPKISHLKRRLYEDFSCTVLPRILKNFDAMSMANSIEVRMPFMDYRLVEYIFSLPDQDLIHKKWTKYILRSAMVGTLDDRVNWRKDKVGFNSPVADMMNGELRDWLAAVMSFKDPDIPFSPEEIKQEFKEKIENNKTWGQSLDFWKKINTIQLIKLYKERKHYA